MNPPISVFSSHRVVGLLACAAASALLAGCGFGTAGVAAGMGDSGAAAAPAPLAIDATAATAPPARAGGCNLVALLRLRVSRPNAAITYSLNGAADVPFTVPETGVVEPELRPGVLEDRYVLLKSGANTVVVKATVGAETVSQTLSIDRFVNAVLVDIEPVDVRGRSMTVAWTLPAAISPTFFSLHFDDGLAPNLDGLQGIAGNGASPLRVPVAQLAPTVVGDRIRYSFTLAGMANAANDFLQYHFVGVRANDGCESRIVAAHTRPRARTVTWPAANAAVADIVPTGGVVAQAPAGGESSSLDVVGMPPLLVDRGADASNQTTGGANTITEVDGLPDLVFADRDGKVFVGRNGGGIFDQVVAVDDVVTPNPPCGALPGGSAGDMIRAFSFDNDGDNRPDLFLLSSRRLTVYAGDAGDELTTSFPTPNELRFLNFRKYCPTSTGLASLQLSNVPGLPSGAQFLDAFHGDFDGDGFQDLVASVGQPQTSTANGSTAAIHIWYAGAGGGVSSWNWPSDSPQAIPVNTAFGDDGYFVVGDIDGDGRDDLLTMKHVDAATARYQAVLCRGRGQAPVVTDVAVVDPRNQTARWDQLALADFDHDRVLDVVGLRTAPFAGSSLVEFVGYRTDLSSPPGPTAPLSSPQIVFSLLSTHATTFPTPPRQRGHFQLVDVGGDGIKDVLVRSIRSTSDYATSVVTRFAGRRNPTTGLQDWFGFNTTLSAVQMPLAVGEKPHVHFAANDLDQDGAPELVAMHQRLVPPHGLVTMLSDTAWQYGRGSDAPIATDFKFGGTLATGTSAGVLGVTTAGRQGDVVTAVDATLGVRVMSATLDEGRGNGGYGQARWIPIQPPLPAEVRAFRLPDDSPSPREIVVLCVDGATASLAYDAAFDRFVPVFGAVVPNAIQLAAARFDTDQRTDAVVIDANNVLHLLTTVADAAGRNGPLSVRGTVTLPRAVEAFVATQIVDDPLADIAVVLAPVSGATARELQVHLVQRDVATGVARLVAPQWTAQFPGPVASLAVANFNGRFRNNLGRRKWILAGMADGRVLAARNGQPAPQTLAGVPQFAGPIEILTGDMNNDNLPDIVVHERGSRQLSIFRNQPDATQPFRFPNPGGYQFQGTGTFDGPAVVTLPETVKAMLWTRVDNDPCGDLLLLSADGQRVHVVLQRAQQESR